MTTAIEAPAVGRLGIPSGALGEWRTLALALAAHGPAPCEGAVLPRDTWWSGAEEDVELAREACGLCPARRECAEYAVAARERAGIWGALTPEERAR